MSFVAVEVSGDADTVVGAIDGFLEALGELADADRAIANGKRLLSATNPYPCGAKNGRAVCTLPKGHESLMGHQFATPGSKAQRATAKGGAR